MRRNRIIQGVVFEGHEISPTGFVGNETGNMADKGDRL